ncbi:hypothetical protein H5410_005459 [Solanum commersonii]|uniref:Uncharacterized protein n=1 Tax=Solanum commersonii TaxID=4109 RepID=A0A9J6A6T3_SOLCO|nr:hypothetical protein H5410_005459 [Solanum commersonii]
MTIKNQNRPSYARLKVEVDLVGEFPMLINIGSKNKTEKELRSVSESTISEGHGRTKLQEEIPQKQRSSNREADQTKRRRENKQDTKRTQQEAGEEINKEIPKEKGKFRKQKM